MRTIFGSNALVIVGVAAVCALAVLAHRPGEGRRPLDEESGRTCELRSLPNAEQRALLVRIEEKELIAKAMLREELTLSEAAARSRAISEHDLTAVARLRNAFPATTEDEMWYRHVLSFASAWIRLDPEHHRSVFERLEAEVASRFLGDRVQLRVSETAQSVARNPKPLPIATAGAAKQDR